MAQNLESSTIVVAATTLAALLVVGVMYWQEKKKQKAQKNPIEETPIPTKWKKVGEVGELLMYPLKGGRRKCLSEVQFTKLGLREIETGNLPLQDRVFMVYDEEHKYVSAKKNSKVLFVNTSAVDDFSIKFSFPDAEDLVVQIPKHKDLCQINLPFGDNVKTVDCGEEAARWFSERLLGKPSGLRLGCHVENLVPPRFVSENFNNYAQAYSKLHSDYMGAYSDLASYMLLGEESVKDLNKRLEKPVTEHNFRPNLLVRGSPAFSEDTWDWIKIGDNVVLRSFMYCTRCVVTTIDPETAQRDATYEPIKTLKTYRKVKEEHLKKVSKDSPAMGMYAGCHQPGTVRLGDPIYINTE